MRPETRFTKTADGVHVAYQLVGDGPIDLVFVIGWTTNVDAIWEEPSLSRYLSRLASMSPVVSGPSAVHRATVSHSGSIRSSSASG